MLNRYLKYSFGNEEVRRERKWFSVIANIHKRSIDYFSESLMLIKCSMQSKNIKNCLS